MHRTMVPAALLAVLSLTTLTACSNHPGSLLDPSTPQSAGEDGSGISVVPGGASDSAIVAPWTPSGPDADTIVSVDSSNYLPTGEGTGSTSDSSTTLIFQASGSGRYGIGTCGANGMWTSADGSVTSPHSPNCLAYYSDGRTGKNGKGKCVKSPEGYAGLWLNPKMHATSPYHAHCVQRGVTTTSFMLSFSGHAALYDAQDGSSSRVLNFTGGDVVQAQLIYHGNTDGTSTGAGVLVGTDDGNRRWTVDFGQAALNYTGGQANGDLVTAMLDPGLQVVACNTVLGCSLVNLRVTLNP